MKHSVVENLLVSWLLPFQLVRLQFVLVKANDAAKLLRNYFAPKFGGGGGGRKDFAKGGLKKTTELPPA